MIRRDYVRAGNPGTFGPKFGYNPTALAVRSTVTTMRTSSDPEPGYYPDPAGSGGQRWWDGSQWTDRTRDRVTNDTAKKKLHRKPWLIGVVSGFLGVVIGFSIGEVPEVEDAPEFQALVGQLEEVQANLDEQAVLQSQVEEQSRQVEQLQNELEARTEEIAQREQEVASTESDLAEREAALVESEQAAQASASAQPQPESSTQPRGFTGGLSDAPAGDESTDTRYPTCTELSNHPNNAPYVRGEDPEYEWYDDRDNDGIVCEWS